MMVGSSLHFAAVPASNEPICDVGSGLAFGVFVMPCPDENVRDEQFFEGMRAKLDAAFVVLRELDAQLRNNQERQRVATFDEVSATAPVERTIVTAAPGPATLSEAQRAADRGQLLAYVDRVYDEAMQLAARPPGMSNAQEREIVRRISVRATVAAAELDWRDGLRFHRADTEPHAERVVRQRAQTVLAPVEEVDDAFIEELEAPHETEITRLRGTFADGARLTPRGARAVAALFLFGALIPLALWTLNHRGRGTQSPPDSVSTRAAALASPNVVENPPPLPAPTATTTDAESTPAPRRRLVKQARPRRQRVSMRQRRAFSCPPSAIMAAGKRFPRS
jgi:hypothetical protein